MEEFHTDDQKAILNLVDFCWTFGIKFNLFNSSHFIQFFVPCEQKKEKNMARLGFEPMNNQFKAIGHFQKVHRGSTISGKERLSS